MAYALDLAEIVIDSREKLPYYSKSPRATLATGDYSLVGYEDRIAIERKSVADAFQSCGKGRWRFIREVGRLALLEWSAIVVEGTRDTLLAHTPPYPRGYRGYKMGGAAVVGTLDSWAAWYSVVIHFESSRMAAKRLVPRLLKIAREYVDSPADHKHKRAICRNCGGGGFVAHRTGCHETQLVSYDDR